MIDFIKTLFSLRRNKLTLVLLEDGKPDEPKTFDIRPQQILHLLLYITVGFFIVFVLLFSFTPVGSLISSSRDRAIRDSVIKMSNKLVNLNDSLDVRSQQLNDIINVIANNRDTTFPVSQKSLIDPLYVQQQSDQLIPPPGETSSNEQFIDNTDILNSDILKNAPEFPTDPPVNGTLTRGFEPKEGHYGIDIAAKTGTYIRAIADGVVINTAWTFNYGYVIYIQHGGGYITIYKHCADLVKKGGDIVLKGDILGTVSQSGLISSGPHVHVELWRNGIALDPTKYLNIH
ncbi:MAG TPA: M23 family metallopeptidase [Balneolales bacterium]|nr:M23 family metallopeptidase [Balneolales bacterium]